MRASLQWPTKRLSLTVDSVFEWTSWRKARKVIDYWILKIGLHQCDTCKGMNALVWFAGGLYDIQSIQDLTILIKPTFEGTTRMGSTKCIFTTTNSVAIQSINRPNPIIDCCSEIYLFLDIFNNPVLKKIKFSWLPSTLLGHTMVLGRMVFMFAVRAGRFQAWW